MTEPVTFFVFASPEKFTGIQEQELLHSMNEFLKNWKSHGVPVRAKTNIEYGHFLTVEILPGSEIPGGCSKDELFRKILEIEKNFNLKLLDRRYFFVYDTIQENITVTTRDGFSKMLKENQKSLKIFETHTTKIEDWRKNPIPFEKSYLVNLI